MDECLTDLQRGKPINATIPRNSWPDGVLAKSVAAVLEDGGSQHEVDILKLYCDRMLAADERVALERIDAGLNGEALLLLSRTAGGERYRDAADHIWSYYQIRAKREGTLAYLEPNPVGLRFVDTLPMVCPFLAKYSVATGVVDARRLSVKQLREFMEFGVDERTGLPFHAYDPASGNAPVGLLGWGRGTGWYALALIDTIPFVSADDRSDLDVRSTDRLIGAVLKYQRSDGGWGARNYSINEPL